MSQTTQRVLFLCTGNSCRSQMAEGWLRKMAGNRLESLSAGAAPADRVHPMAIQVMAEAGIDISGQRPKSIDDFLDDPPDVVISVCERAASSCPVFPGRVQRLSWPYDDPAEAQGTAEDKLRVFRRVRDEIRVRVEAELEDLASMQPGDPG